MNKITRYFLALLSTIIIFNSAAIAETILGHTVYGSGDEKVIVLHDWMGDASNYDTMKPYLDKDKFTWIFADVRGYGNSLNIKGEYTVNEIAKDVFKLADSMGWKKFHIIGHSMNGMSIQRMALDDWISGGKRLKSIIAITPVTADGYPADEDTRKFLFSAIHNKEVSEMAFGALTGKRLSATWGRVKTTQNLKSSSKEAMKAYYKMWLDTDFSKELSKAKVETPILVIGGRNDLPGFQEEYYQKTFAKWYPNVTFKYITDAGHYPMYETPIYLASLIETFLNR